MEVPDTEEDRGKVPGAGAVAAKLKCLTGCKVELSKFNSTRRAVCGGPGCSDSRRQFLSGRSVFCLAACAFGGRLKFIGSPMLPSFPYELTCRVSLSQADCSR
jgi:hypothetical protein